MCDERGKGAGVTMDGQRDERMDVRPSRRDRLASIPPDHLLLMGRDWVVGGDNEQVCGARDQGAGERGGEGQ